MPEDWRMRAESEKVLAVLLAAGKSTRMKSRVPKVLLDVNGKPLLAHALEAVMASGVRRLLVVTGQGEAEVRSFVRSRYGDEKIGFVHQPHPRGTGHALLCAEKAAGNRKGLILVVPGDAPGVRSSTIRALIRAHRQKKSSATILTARLSDPSGYGRILRRSGEVVGIREEPEARSFERRISEINSGIYVFDSETLFRHVPKIRPGNRKKEYYLTDVIESFVREGLRVVGFQAEEEAEVRGINSRQDLARLEVVMNLREIRRHQENGVTVVSPENTFIAAGVTVGKDSVIYPFTWIETGVKIGNACRIGPFAVVRKNSRVGDGATIGCFVEVVRSSVGKKSRVKHLSYLGDARLGNDVNIGAGTVTANYDGIRKQKTVIRDGAFIGSNTVLVAPVTVGAKAKTGAGSVVLSRSRVPAGKTLAGVPARILPSKQKSSLNRTQ